MRSILDYIKVFKNIEMYKDPKLRYAKAEISPVFDPDLEQSEPLRPGETLETWKPNPFLKPHAEGGRAGYNDGNTVLPEPNPLSQEERNQKVFNDYVERFKEYLKGSKMPEWFVKDLIKEKAKELGIELADGGRAGYNDGQLVRPTVDGSRAGYSGKEKDLLGRDTVLIDGRWQITEPTGDFKKWYDQTYTKKWGDQKSRANILEAYDNWIKREKPPEGYISVKDYGTKYEFRELKPKWRETPESYLNQVLKTEDVHTKTGKVNLTKKFIVEKLKPKKFPTRTGEGGAVWHVKDLGQSQADEIHAFLKKTNLDGNTVNAINKILDDNKIVKLFTAGDYKGVKKALKGVEGITDAQRGNSLLRIAQLMSGTTFRNELPNIKLNKLSAKKLIKGLDNEKWGTPYADTFKYFKRSTIRDAIGNDYFTKNYKAFVTDARAEIAKALNMTSKDFKALNIDINELTGLTNAYKNQTFSSSQFINLMDAEFNQGQHANLMKQYGKSEAKLQKVLSGKKPNFDEAAKIVKGWKTWKDNWFHGKKDAQGNVLFKGLDEKYRTKAVADILPDFKLGDNASKIFTAKRLEEFRKMNFPIAEEIKKMGYAKTVGKTKEARSAIPLLWEIATGDKKAIGQILKTYQNGGIGKNCKAYGGRVGFKNAGAVGISQCMKNAIDEHNKNLQSDNPVVRNKARSKQFNINRTKNMKNILNLGGKGVSKVLRFGKAWGAEWEPIFEGAFYEWARRKGYTHDQAKEETFFYKMLDPKRQTGIFEGAESLLEKELIGSRWDPGRKGENLVGAYIDNQKRMEEISSEWDSLDFQKKGHSRAQPSSEQVKSFENQQAALAEEYQKLDQLNKPDSLSGYHTAYQTAVEKQQTELGVAGLKYGEYGSGDTEKLVKQRERRRQREMEEKFPDYKKSQLDKMLEASGYVIDPNIAKYKKDLEFLTKEDIPTTYQPAFPPGVKAKPVSTHDMIRGILSGEDKLRYYADNFRMEKAGGGLTRTVAPDSGPMDQGLRSLYINDKDY